MFKYVDYGKKEEGEGRLEGRRLSYYRKLVKVKVGLIGESDV
jgi:hypothetical protein